MHKFFDRHAKVALMFSGGRDSLACLHLCQPFLDQITVVWVNPGNPYPETIAQMAEVRASVPNFIEVPGNQPDFIRDFGYPADVVPMSMTKMGRAFSRTPGVVVTSYMACCSANLWEPAARHIENAGYTGVIRGDRLEDALKPPLQSGDILNGVEYLFPLEQYTAAQVLDLVGQSLPKSYARGVRTSLDCMNCTAYMAHNGERLADLKTTSPKTYSEVCNVINAVAQELGSHIKLIDESGVIHG